MTAPDLPDELLETESLPTIPAIAVEILRLCRDPETTLDDLASVISLDAALTARLLRFANSTLYNLGSEVSSLQRATLVLGMKTVQLMSLTFSLASGLPRSGHAAFDYHRLWERGLIRAVAGRMIAERAGTMNEDEAFLGGLLAEIGMIVLASALPEEYSRVLETSNGGWPSEASERRILGYSHADVGEAVLAHWGFPAVIRRAVGFARRPDELPDDESAVNRSTAQILAIACQITRVLTEASPANALAKLEQDALGRYGITSAELDALIGSLESSVRETAELLNLTSPEALSSAEILAEARAEYARKDVGEHQTQGDPAEPPSPLERFRSQGTFVDTELNLPNRRAFDRFLTEQIDARLSGKATRPVGVIRVSVDSLDELEGEGVADVALDSIADLFAILVRKSDLLASFGDGTFGVVMIDATPFGLKVLAERLRRGVEEEVSLSGERELPTTVTVAGLCLGEVRARTDGIALLNAAEHYLREAVSKGGNHCLVRKQILRASA